MATFSQVKEAFFEDLNSHGFFVKDEKVGNGYFIFEMGDDSVVHFKIKGIPFWKFGIWISRKEAEAKTETEGYTPTETFLIQLFAQETSNIDKFKPGASFYSKELTYIYDKDKDFFSGPDLRFDVKEFDYSDMIAEIKYHPFLAFYKNESFGRYANKFLIYYYLKSHLDTFLYNMIKSYDSPFKIGLTKIILFFIQRKFASVDVVKSVKVIDHNTAGFTVIPRFNMNIIFKKETCEEDSNKISSFLDKYERFDDNKLIHYIMKDTVDVFYDFE